MQSIVAITVAGTQTPSCLPHMAVSKTYTIPHVLLSRPDQAFPIHTHTPFGSLERLERLCKVPVEPSHIHSSLALKVRRGGEEGNALIHDGLAHPQIGVHPLLHARGVAELVGLYTGTERQPVSLWPCCKRFGGKGVWGAARVRRELESAGLETTYVRPVERRTPARKAETAGAGGQPRGYRSG